MTQVTMVHVEQAAPAVAVAPPPPPLPQRRPRVREVSSRFMSPVPSSSPNHKQQRHRRNQDNREMEHTSSVDENHRHIETARSLESPFQFQRRHQHQRRSGNSLRPDTPTLFNSSSSSSLSSRSRVIQRSNSASATAATKLLQSLSSQPSNNPSSQDDTSSTISDDTSSQISEVDMLPSVSARLLAERNVNKVNINVTAGDPSKLFSASPCSRSLHLPLPTYGKGSEKPTPVVSRSYTNSGKLGAFSLPPVAPPQPKPGTDARKVTKVSSHQEDIKSLKLLHNHYLQWRFANAKAEASMQAQRRETERTLYSLGVRISDLYDSVKRKRIELGILQRTKALSTILEAQMPYLDEWCAFEGDYSNSLSETIQALVNASLQLPIGGNVRADVSQVGEALNSAMRLMETIILHVQSFMPKAEEVEILISELAKVAGGERALIEECGGLLSKTHGFQVEECSLKGQLMQLHKRRPGQFQEETKNLSANAIHMR